MFILKYHGILRVFYFKNLKAYLLSVWLVKAFCTGSDDLNKFANKQKRINQSNFILSQAFWS